MRNFKKISLVVFSTFFSALCFCSDLTISIKDIRLEPDASEGFHLFVRAKSEIKSILLTETTKDPEGTSANYSYRAAEWNTYNGDEIRILNGEPLTSDYAKYSLIDSTPEKDTEFGEAFHIYIPPKILWGYPWTRNGVTEISMGTFVNIRTFQKPHADYMGGYIDNPFMFDFKAPQKTPKTPTLTSEYSPAAVQAFNEISNNLVIYSQGPETIANDILQSFNEISPKNKIDVVFAIDATGSMWNIIEHVQEKLVPELAKALEKCTEVRLGLLWYRDYGDNFSMDGLPVQLNKFTYDTDLFFERLNKMNIPQGSLIGGDIPEAVYEALYASIVYYPWDSEAEKKIILVGDAEPHPKPRGVKQIGKDTVEKLAKQKNITIDCIIIPTPQ
ncbi:MAG TPA: vWA domain-containing protein [Treponemataceae bacterium]|nr:vWA domain-containing protein [Treponemataceae bacterium]